MCARVRGGGPFGRFERVPVPRSFAAADARTRALPKLQVLEDGRRFVLYCAAARVAVMD